MKIGNTQVDTVGKQFDELSVLIGFGEGGIQINRLTTDGPCNEDVLGFHKDVTPKLLAKEFRQIANWLDSLK
jgi:hypothetical protein